MLSRRCFISPLPSPASPPWLPNVASMSLSFPLLPPLPSFSSSGAALRSFSSFPRSPPLRSSRRLTGFSFMASRGSSSSRALSDYYDTLNVDRDATLQEIKSAYRKLARQVSSCSKCGGSGKVLKDPCKRCGGESTVHSKRIVNVDIPPGVSDGLTLKVRGEGNVDTRRGIAGDIYIHLHVKEKAGVQRNGLDLYSDISIDYTEAILGTVVKWFRA